MITTITKFGTWGGIFGRRSKLVKEIAGDLRALIVGLHPETMEIPRKGWQAVYYGLGEKKMSEAYCYIMPHTGYVNLGMCWGAVLDDPNGLLEGTGKKMRHVKINDRETARSAKIAHLVYLAIEERRTGLLKAAKAAKTIKATKNKRPSAKKKVSQKKLASKKAPVKRKKTTKETA